MRRPLLVVAALGPLTLSCAYINASGLLDDATSGAMNDLALNSGQLVAKGQECRRLATFDVPLGEEISIGGAVAVKWVSKGGGLVMDSNDPAAKASGPRDQMALYVDRVGRNLAMQSDRPLIEWTFGVLESDDFNAVSAPGGYVLVTRGLLRAVENEAQLAGVLGHEIAHVTEKHAIAAYRKVKTDTCLSAFGGMVLGPVTEHLRAAFDAALGEAGAALDLDSRENFDVLFAFTDALTTALDDHGFEVEQEHDADRIGLALAIGAGYNPHEYVKFLARIPETGAAFPHHPSNAERQQRLAQFIDSYREQPELYPDYPFQNAPVVPLRGELSAAAKP